MLEQSYFRFPLLRVLVGAGGSLSRPEALAAMEVELAAVLGPDDRVPMDDRPREEGWRNRTSWEVKKLKEEGLMLPTTDAGRGRWALTDAGSAVALRHLGSGIPIGSAYVDPPRPTPVARADPFAVDPDLVDRGLAAHHDTVQALVAWLRARGCAALQPVPGAPSYDLAWRDGADVHVAEIKSLTSANEERQLRLGLGQVLRYRQALEKLTTGPVRAWLVVERMPADLSWSDLCDRLDVHLTSPALLP